MPRIRLALALTLGFVPPAPAADDGPGPLRGEWACAWRNDEGMAAAVDAGAEANRANPWLHPIFAADAWTARPAPGAEPRPHVRIVEGAEGGRRTIDLVGLDGVEVLGGIFEIQGDLLRIALPTEPGAIRRPSDFNALPGDRRVVLAYLRAPATDPTAARQARIALASAECLAEAATGEAFAKLSIRAAAGPVPAFDVGAAHGPSPLLAGLRAAIGVRPERIGTNQFALIGRSSVHLLRATEPDRRMDRLMGESRAEVRARLRQRIQDRDREPPKP